MPSISLPPGSVFPKYDSYCISGIPSTALDMLGVKLAGPKLPDDAFGSVDCSSIDNVVLLVVDGLGMNEWKRQQSWGLLRALSSGGSVKPITTVFPSTTAAALTTFATGLTTQEHALPEWFVYMREVDAVVVTLPFSFVGDYGRETLKGHMKPRALFNGTSIFQRLKREGVPAHSFVSRALVNTTYSTLVHRASDRVPYVSSSDLAASLRRKVESARGPSFFYAYWSYLDSIEHKYGPNTDESELEASAISFILQKGFVEKLDRRTAKRTLLMVSADHGQVNVNIRDTLYLNRFGRLVRGFRKTRAGDAITPAGNARDVFLYADEDKLEDMHGLLTRKLAGKATVLRTEDAIRAGLFGLNGPSAKFRERAGNLLILPHGNRTIWYRGKRGYDLDLLGHHGGLSRDEMTVPFAVGRLSELQDQRG